MLYAQSVVEYGAIASMAAAAQRTLYVAQDWFTRQGPTTWIAIGAVVVVWLVFSRARRSRF